MPIVFMLILAVVLGITSDLKFASELYAVIVFAFIYYLVQSIIILVTSWWFWVAFAVALFLLYGWIEEWKFLKKSST